MSEQQSSQEINDIYNLYARAIDEKRYELLDTIFSEEAELHYIVGREEFKCKGQNRQAILKHSLICAFGQIILLAGRPWKYRQQCVFYS